MSRYDLSRASNAALCAVVRVTVADLWPGAPAIDEDPASLDECQVKTRAEHDREIGQWLRLRLRLPIVVPPLGCSAPLNWKDGAWAVLQRMVEASRSAPEGES